MLIHPFAAADMQRFCDEPGRERQEDHHQQDEQVEPQEERIDSGELASQGGVQEPRDADRQEADDVGQIEGPGMKQLLQRRARSIHHETQCEQCASLLAATAHSPRCHAACAGLAGLRVCVRDGLSGGHRPSS
jgi:hypothetical protein